MHLAQGVPHAIINVATKQVVVQGTNEGNLLAMALLRAPTGMVKVVYNAQQIFTTTWTVHKCRANHALKPNAPIQTDKHATLRAMERQIQPCVEQNIGVNATKRSSEN